MFQIKFGVNYYWCGDIHKYWAILFAAILLLFGYADLSQSEWVNGFVNYFTGTFFENVGKNYAASEYYQYVRSLFSVAILLMPFIFFSFMYCSRKRWEEHVGYVTVNNTHFQYMLYLWSFPFLGYMFMVDILGVWSIPSVKGENTGGIFIFILTHSMLMNTVWAYMLVVGFCHSLVNAINYISIGINKKTFRK